MSAKKKPLVVVTRRLPDIIETRMRELFDARLNLTDEKMPHEALVEAVRQADVLVPTINDKIDAAVIEAAGDRLKLIANFGNGVDNIDVEAATARKIAVLFYNTLRHGMHYRDPGADHYEQQYRGRVLANRQRRAKYLGFVLQPIPGDPDPAVS